MVQWASLRSLALVMLLVWGCSQALSWWQDQRFAEAVRLGSQRHELVVYSTDTCPYCARARAWLDANGARWRECNVERDAACQRSYQDQGAPGVPLVQVRSQSGAPPGPPSASLWHLGFSPAWVASAMDKLSAQGPTEPPAPRAAQAASPSLASSPRP